MPDQARSALRGIPFELQAPGTTTGNGNVVAVNPRFNSHKISIIGSAGISAGAIQIEAADSVDYSGTWAQIGGGPITAVASTTLIQTFTGLFKFIRARISTNIVDGSVGITYEGN